MSWYALAPTILVAVIIAAVALIKPGAPARVSVPSEAGEAAPESGALPTLSLWARDIRILLRSARQPVWPIDHTELNVRTRRGITVAFVIVMVAVFVAADGARAGGFMLLGLILSIPLAGLGGLISVIHTLALLLLPHRGLIVSTALGALLGLAATIVGWHSMPLRSDIVYAGVIYGFTVGLIDFFVPLKKRERSQRQPVTRLHVRSVRGRPR